MAAARPLTLAEFDALVATLKHPRDRALVLVAAASGARVAELCSATLAQVMGPGYTLTGALELPRRQTKGKRRSRTQPMAPRALRALDAWLQAHPSPLLASPLFPALRPPLRALTPRQVQRIIAAAATTAKIPGPVSPHSLRKLYGTQVYGHSARDIALTAALLGHASPQSTMHYLDLDGTRRSAAALAVFDHADTTPGEAQHGQGIVDRAS